MSVQELSCQEQTYLTSAKTVNAFSIASIMNNNCAEEPDRALTRESVISDDYSRSSSDCSSYEPAPKRIRACSHDIEEEEEDDTEETLSIPRDPELDKIHVNLECKELWAKFSSLGTEMIITKAGRRMFPVVRVRVSGLNPSHHYLVAMDIDPVDDMRYRYAYHRSTWLVAGKADPQPVKRYYLHPDCPFTGDQLQGQVISFEKVKLTNNELDTNNHIILNSMHKYQPRVHIIRRPDKWNGSCDKMTMSQRHARTFAFPETTFIAVTAYQNQLITKLKINSNPFAKGFRDSSRFLTAERPHKMPPPLACRCNTGTPFLCPHARGFMVPDEKEFYASYAAAAGQAQATLAVPDLVYKPGQYAAIPTDEAGNPPYPYLPQTAIPVGLDYSYHKAIPHLSPDGHPYPHQQYPIPSTSVENFTTAAPVFTTFANMWSSTAAPTTYAQRYNVK